MSKIYLPVYTVHDCGLLRWSSRSQIKRYKLCLIPIQEKYSKYIDILYHYIKDLIEDEQVKLISSRNLRKRMRSFESSNYFKYSGVYMIESGNTGFIENMYNERHERITK